MSSWSLIRTADGSPTLVHPLHGQACHSRAGAWQEARERYAQACLSERSRERSIGRELHLLDVGTGLGLNLAAALEALEGTGIRLHALTLELERDVIERTLELARTGELHEGAPPELARHHATVLAALESALRSPAPVSLGALTLELLLGDGRDTLARTPLEPCFDAVFLDPFSPRVDPALWERGFLAQVARRMQPAAVLSTYSSSLGVRAALAAAGLALAPGGRVGTKAAGTLASFTPFEQAFDPRTARRIARRSAALGAPG